MTFIAGRMYFYINLIFFVIVCSVHRVGFDVWQITSSCQNKLQESVFKKVESFYCVTFDFPSSLFSVWAYLTSWHWSLFMSPKNIKHQKIRFFDVFRGYRKRPMTSNGSIRITPNFEITAFLATNYFENKQTFGNNLGVNRPIPNSSFLYPLKIAENLTVFWWF